jgi:hypothetical protein
MSTNLLHVEHFIFVRAPHGALCMGPAGAFVFEQADIPVLEQLSSLRGNLLPAQVLTEKLFAANGAPEIGLIDVLIDKGLLRRHSKLPSGYGALTVLTDDDRVSVGLRGSAVLSGRDLTFEGLDQRLALPATDTLLLTYQSLYRPGYLESLRELNSGFLQINAYCLGPTLYVDPPYCKALGTPCHRCFVARLAHEQATAADPNESNWLAFQAALDEFKPHFNAKELRTDIEAGLVTFHLHRIVSVYLDGPGIRFRPEDLQSVASIDLATGAVRHYPLAHWELCDCLQLDVEGTMT